MFGFIDTKKKKAEIKKIKKERTKKLKSYLKKVWKKFEKEIEMNEKNLK
ncbi:hypothetical protein [Methanimicrococcus hongohii]|nr:hypothetical protein [Methanimicrococcus sp. Hf6]